MKKIYCWLFLLSASFALTPGASAQTTITGAQVFNSSMLGQSWTFTNNLGDQTFISIEPLPANNAYVSNCLQWNYQKSRGRAYWSPGAIGAGLHFILCPQVDGSWISAGSLMHGTTGAGGTGTFWSSTAQVQQVPGEQFPGYLIIPAQGGSTASTMPSHYKGYSLANVETYSSIIGNPATTTSTVPWTTIASVAHICVPFQNWCGDTLVSEQLENCDSTMTNGGCVHEKWYLAPGLGLVQVDVLYEGNVWAGFCALDPDVRQCFTLDKISFKRTY
jgi:hypothetical protein